MEVTRFTGNYVFKVTTEEKTGKDNKVYILERVYMRSGVSVIAVTSEGKFRLVQEASYWDDGKTKRVKPVTGWINNEEPLTCAQRELEEELGLKAEKWDLFLKHESHGSIQKTQYYFLAYQLTQSQTHPEGLEKFDGFQDFTAEQIREMALAGHFGTSESGYAMLKLGLTY
ncbi:MAG: NUDIX domain-containing protein [Patescibacteria group bacterium]